MRNMDCLMNRAMHNAFVEVIGMTSLAASTTKLQGQLLSIGLGIRELAIGVRNAGELDSSFVAESDCILVFDGTINCVFT